MKVFYFLITLVMVNACKTTSTNNADTTTTTEKVTMDQDACPEKGECSTKVLKNSSLVLREDTTGALYPVIEKGDNIVIEYTYLEKGPEGTADGNYSETIHFEVSDSIEKLNLLDASLQEVKFLYGKHCFCKGEAGYYKIKKGSLSIVKSGSELNFNFTFKIDETSQRIESIAKTIQL